MIKSAAASTHTFCFIIDFLKCKEPGIPKHLAYFKKSKVKEKAFVVGTIYQIVKRWQPGMSYQVSAISPQVSAISDQL
jgi:hypothetical protein